MNDNGFLVSLFLGDVQNVMMIGQIFEPNERMNRVSRTLSFGNE